VKEETMLIAAAPNKRLQPTALSARKSAALRAL